MSEVTVKLDGTRSSGRPMNIGKPDWQLAEHHVAAQREPTRASLDIRPGDIYALERLAQDFPEEQPIVVNNLSAFVLIRVARRSGIGHGRPQRSRCTHTACRRIVRIPGHTGGDGAALTGLGPPPCLPEAVL